MEVITYRFHNFCLLVAQRSTKAEQGADVRTNGVCHTDSLSIRLAVAEDGLGSLQQQLVVHEPVKKLGSEAGDEVVLQRLDGAPHAPVDKAPVCLVWCQDGPSIFPVSKCGEPWIDC